VAASRARDPVALRECYFPGLPEEELDSWLAVNLRPEAAVFLEDARWIGFTPTSRVEGTFRFLARAGTEAGQGVMVWTRKGWKILRW
jgi:hypothetical protein